MFSTFAFVVVFILAVSRIEATLGTTAPACPKFATPDVCVQSQLNCSYCCQTQICMSADDARASCADFVIDVPALTCGELCEKFTKCETCVAASWCSYCSREDRCSGSKSENCSPFASCPGTPNPTSDASSLPQYAIIMFVAVGVAVVLLLVTLTFACRLRPSFQTPLRPPTAPALTDTTPLILLYIFHIRYS